MTVELLLRLARVEDQSGDLMRDGQHGCHAGFLTPGGMTSRHILDVICSLCREGCQFAPSPGEAIIGPGTTHHGPFGRIEVLNSLNGRWCLSRACLLAPGARRGGQSREVCDLGTGGRKGIVRHSCHRAAHRALGPLTSFSDGR